MPVPLEEVQWIHGSLDCAENSDPLIQVHQFDQNTFILRVNKCFTYEGNFLYLLIGSKRAILFDTGARPDSGEPAAILPVREIVEGLIAQWQQEHGVAEIDLVVAHTHSHSDHATWDAQFAGRPRTVVIRPSLPSVVSFFGLSSWPEGKSELQLGDRLLTVLPIPGHDSAHIAVHDGATNILLTGDTLYPGKLTVRDWPAYRRSAARLADFADQHEIFHVLGAHIEMKNTPREFYQIGTKYQPEEHSLPLTVKHVQEWHAACDEMENAPHTYIHDDFIISIA